MGEARITIEEAMRLAVEHHQAGRLAQAEQLYRQVLAREPRHCDAIYLQGTMAAQLGRNDVAVQWIGDAIAINPGVAQYHSNLGEIYRRLGKLDLAEQSLQRSLELQPGYDEAHNNLGVLLKEKGQLEEAIAHLQKAVELNPGGAQAWCNLSGALREQGRFREAIAACRNAIRLKPDYSEAYGILGAALACNQEMSEALGAYRRAAELRPDDAAAHADLGAALISFDQAEKAVESCSRAIQLNPSDARSYNNLGIALAARWQLDEAAAAYQKAVEIDPGRTEAYNNLANAYKDMGKLDEAIACFDRALALNPGQADWHSNRLLMLHSFANYEADAMLHAHQAWDHQHGLPLRGEMQLHANDRSPERRLKIGYVSADFRQHSVAWFIVELLAGHDASQVEIFCYGDVRYPDVMTDGLRQLAHHWRDTIGQGHRQLAEQIRADGIDILVDLAGHTAGNRLLVFARKPAPVQVTYLGYPDTTGLSAIDYRLSDALADPAGSERYCSEELIRLPRCFLCFSPPRREVGVSGLPCLRAGRITFGSFNALPKLNGQVIACWSEILRRVPESRLLIKNPSLSCQPARDQVLRLFVEQGIAAERIELHGKIPARADHLALYGQVDIGLDPFPYNGATTTCEALWMGVPVVTLAGKSHMGRVGTSLLTNLDLPEMIAPTVERYIAIAVELAGDPERLQGLRGSLRDRMVHSPIMDGRGFAWQVEAVYRRIWRRWCGST